MITWKDVTSVVDELDNVGVIALTAFIGTLPNMKEYASWILDAASGSEIRETETFLAELVNKDPKDYSLSAISFLRQYMTERTA